MVNHHLLFNHLLAPESFSEELELSLKSNLTLPLIIITQFNEPLQIKDQNCTIQFRSNEFTSKPVTKLSSKDKISVI